MSMKIPKYPKIPKHPNISNDVVYEMGINSIKILGKPRKLSASWTIEIEQDLKAYYNPDTEAELSKLLAKTIENDIMKLGG